MHVSSQRISLLLQIFLTDTVMYKFKRFKGKNQGNRIDSYFNMLAIKAKCAGSWLAGWLAGWGHHNRELIKASNC